MVETYIIHASIQILSFLLYGIGVFLARKHKMKDHHRLVYSGVILNTIAVSLMIYESRGLPTIHGKLGFSVYLLMVVTTLSGRLFLKRRLKRSNHRILSYLAIISIFIVILNGLISFVFLF